MHFCNNGHQPAGSTVVRAVWYTVEMYGVLYVIATPIGNLGDVSFRAVEMLRSVHSIPNSTHYRTTRRLMPVVAKVHATVPAPQESLPVTVIYAGVDPPQPA